MKTCPHCRVEFEPHNDRQLYCSRRCRHQEQKKRSAIRKNPIVSLVCSVCGVVAERRSINRGGNKPKTCGKSACIKAHKKELKKLLYRKYAKAGIVWPCEDVRLQSNKEDVFEQRAIWRDVKLERRELCVHQERMNVNIWDYVKTCRYCGNKYLSRSKTEKGHMYCSDRCLWNAKNARDKARNDPKALMRRLSKAFSRGFGCWMKRKTHGGSYLSKQDIIGYRWIDLMRHIESQFEPHMTWDNWGEWHIDHRIPITWFNYERTEDLKKCYALTNLMPRWKTTAIARKHGSIRIGNEEKKDRLILEA
jgi:hypothetical protein